MNRKFEDVEGKLTALGGNVKQRFADVTNGYADVPNVIQTSSAQVTAGASVDVQYAVPSVGKSPNVQYPSGNNSLFARGSRGK